MAKKTEVEKAQAAKKKFTKTALAEMKAEIAISNKKKSNAFKKKKAARKIRTKYRKIYK